MPFSRIIGAAAVVLVGLLGARAVDWYPPEEMLRNRG